MSPNNNSNLYLYWASQVAQLVKTSSAMQRPLFNSWVRKFPWRRDSYPLLYSWASLVAQTVKNPPEM